MQVYWPGSIKPLLTTVMVAARRARHATRDAQRTSSPQAHCSLWQALFQRAPAGHTPRFYCAYVCRAVLTQVAAYCAARARSPWLTCPHCALTLLLVLHQRQLLDTAREMGFAVEDEPVAAFLPDGRHSIDATSLAGMHMYVLTLPPRAEQQPQGALHA